VCPQTHAWTEFTAAASTVPAVPPVSGAWAVFEAFSASSLFSSLGASFFFSVSLDTVGITLSCTSLLFWRTKFSDGITIVPKVNVNAPTIPYIAALLMLCLLLKNLFSFSCFNNNTIDKRKSLQNI
jgi:hypothetical protein